MTRATTAPSPRTGMGNRPVAIVGGAGFIGANLAESFLSEGKEVLIIDNLSRPGVERNLDWLRGRYGERMSTHIADIRQAGALRNILGDAGAVFHLAAQTAVTTSLRDPMEDFEVNARGTLNVLEAVRATRPDIPVILSSTNKVYGGLEDLAMAERPDRYQPLDKAAREFGIDETRPLAFCTPYGCSKGVADQYVLDYAKSYGLRTAVLRMSCVYGPHQFGTEDQGWVAHFLIRALRREPIAIYGDGKQVRDVLDVSDAVAAYRAARDRIDAMQGQAFNLGGGPRNAISLIMLVAQIERLTGHRPEIRFSDWRSGDQFYFVADTRKLEQATGWRAQVHWADGVTSLFHWLMENRLDAASEPTQALA